MLGTNYVFTIVTKEPLTQEEKMLLFEALEVSKKSISSAIRTINDQEWDEIFKTLDKVSVN